MNTRERVAKAMYEAPDPDETESSTPWPPNHPDDREFWLTHANAAITAMNERPPFSSQAGLATIRRTP